MRKTATTTNTPQQQTTKRSKPAVQAQETAAQAQETAAHPASWTQLSFGLNVPTWQEEYKKRKKAK